MSIISLNFKHLCCYIFRKTCCRYCQSATQSTTKQSFPQLTKLPNGNMLTNYCEYCIVPLFLQLHNNNHNTQRNHDEFARKYVFRTSSIATTIASFFSIRTCTPHSAGTRTFCGAWVNGEYAQRPATIDSGDEGRVAK